MNEWFSVDKALPPPGLGVLVYAPPKDWNAFQSYPFAITSMTTGPEPPRWALFGGERITHWMFLPKEPSSADEPR